MTHNNSLSDSLIKLDPTAFQAEVNGKVTHLFLL